MSKHGQFVAAAMREIPNPSQAVAAYIVQYQTNLPILDNPNASDEDRQYAVGASTRLFYRCTKSEQQRLNEIQKGL